MLDPMRIARRTRRYDRQRVAQLDGIAMGTSRSSPKRRTCPYPIDIRKTKDHLAALAERSRPCNQVPAYDATEGAGDADAADILTAFRATFTELWFIKSHLE